MKLGGEKHLRDFHCSLTHASYVRTGGWTSQCNLHITGFQNVYSDTSYLLLPQNADCAVKHLSNIKKIIF